jgi:hypothetical protein
MVGGAGGQKVHFKVIKIYIILKNHADHNIIHIYDAQCFFRNFLCSQNGYYAQKEGKKMTIVLLKNLTIFDYKSNMKKKSLIILS